MQEGSEAITIFVSTQRVDHPLCRALVDQLIHAGFKVLTSPRNPIDGDDPRWQGWYAQGLALALDQADWVIIFIEWAWDSSTWMAIEADESLKLFQQDQLRRLYCYNPDHIDPDTIALGMRRYVHAAVPLDLAHLLTNRAQEGTGTNP